MIVSDSSADEPTSEMVAVLISDSEFIMETQYDIKSPCFSGYTNVMHETCDRNE